MAVTKKLAFDVWMANSDSFSSFFSYPKPTGGAYHSRFSCRGLASLKAGILLQAMSQLGILPLCLLTGSFAAGLRVGNVIAGNGVS